MHFECASIASHRVALAVSTLSAATLVASLLTFASSIAAPRDMLRLLSSLILFIPASIRSADFWSSVCDRVVRSWTSWLLVSDSVLVSDFLFGPESVGSDSLTSRDDEASDSAIP